MSHFSLTTAPDEDLTVCSKIKGTDRPASQPGLSDEEHNSSSAVVKLKCDTNCNVGETKGPLNLRMNGHRDDWKHSRFERSPVAEHFGATEHDFLKHASVCCIDHSPEWTDSTRKSRESYWIRRLNTLRPHGINKND